MIVKKHHDFDSKNVLSTAIVIVSYGPTVCKMLN